MVQFDPRTYEFPNVPAFVVFDRENRDKYPILGTSVPFDSESAISADWLIEAPTLRKLANQIAVDPDGLDQQVREFNKYAERGLDPIFHRGESAFERARGDSSSGNSTLGPIGHGPYFAYGLRVGCFGTKGGPVIDGNAQILDFEDRPIRGLYAAGNVTAGIFGPAYPGSGSTLGPAITFGYLAGRSAVGV
jgi:hypothetical protein